MSAELVTERQEPVEIFEVAGGRRTAGLTGNLEAPSASEGISGFWLPIAGWALALSGEPVDIQIRCGAQVLLRAARGIERPDIQAAHPAVRGADRSGFSIAFGAVRLPQRFELAVDAVGDGERFTLARVRGARRPLSAVEDLPLDPLLLTTLGRTGSTLMMALLSQHPQVAAFRPSAFDSRPVAYALEAAAALASPASRLRLLDSTGAGSEWWLGAGPSRREAVTGVEGPAREVLMGSLVERLLGDAIRSGLSAAGELAAADGRLSPRYGAEKCWPGYIPRLAHELAPGTREIFLVRDFRDVLTSMLAFNAKRGFLTFGREDVESDQAFVDRLAVDVDALATSWRERREHAFLVRYEELVADPRLVLAELCDYLELDTPASHLDAIVDGARQLLAPSQAQHQTSPDGSRSTGRWRTELPEMLREECEQAFAPALREFGYL